MIKIEKTEAFNFEGAIRGMRNPLNSWDKIDSGIKYYGAGEGKIFIGPSDMKRMQSLIKGGPDHAKFMRQIMVCMDIIGPLYW